MGISGIECIKRSKYSIFYIFSLSGEMKDIIRDKLSTICYGAANAVTGRPMYCYTKTLKEFIKRYNKKTEDQKKGMIGELLMHILLLEFLQEYQIDSPFFNMEERNVKKGFDVVLNKKGTVDLWLVEVKSGNLLAKKNSSQTVVSLINKAEKDLNDRLNDNEDSLSLWLNAINGAKVAIDESRNERDAIISILQDCGDAVVEKTMKSQNINVILAGTLFSSLTDKIIEDNVSDKYNRVNKDQIFKDVFLVAIQKETYVAIYDFLESESRLDG